VSWFPISRPSFCVSPGAVPHVFFHSLCVTLSAIEGFAFRRSANYLVPWPVLIFCFSWTISNNPFLCVDVVRSHPATSLEGRPALLDEFKNVVSRFFFFLFHATGCKPPFSELRSSPLLEGRCLFCPGVTNASNNHLCFASCPFAFFFLCPGPNKTPPKKKPPKKKKKGPKKRWGRGWLELDGAQRFRFRP